MKHNDFLPIGRAADYLAVSIDTLRRWEEKEKIHSKRLDGKNRYFHINDLDRLKYGDTVTVKEAAKRLAMSPATLRRLSEEGQVPFVRDTSGYRQYSVAVLEDIVSQGKLITQQASAGDTVHGGNERVPHPSMRAHLLHLHRSITKSHRTWKLTLSTVLLFIFGGFLSFSLVLYFFIRQPEQAAAFFQFGYTVSNGEIRSKPVLPEGQATKLAAALLQEPAKEAVRIIRAVNPETGQRFILPEEDVRRLAQTLTDELKGEPGEDGASGLPGPEGPRGEQGTQGVSGHDGKNGEQSPQGQTGATGSQGLKGDAGTTGAAGADGSFSGRYSSSNGLVIEAYGTGVGETTAIEFYELAANGANYVGFKAPDSVTTTTVWALPAADGTSGQCLSTNGSGSFSFAECVGAAINSLNGLSGSTQTFATGTSGSDFNISSSGTAHTFNIPNASTTIRGLVATGAQTFAGSKTFSGNVLTQAGTTLGDSSSDFVTFNASSLTFNSAAGIQLADSQEQALTISNLMTFDTLNDFVSLHGSQALIIYGDYSATANAKQFTVARNSNTDQRISLGFHDNGYGSLQAISSVNNNTGTTLVLNPVGGNVGVGGDTTPNSLFSVGSASQFQINSSGAITASAGLTTTGAIAAPTSTDTLNGLVINSGALSNISTLVASTSITNPMLIGGTGTNSTLALRSTSGVGASGADIIFQTGTNGATEAMRILNSGNVGIGVSNPSQKLVVQSDYAASVDAKQLLIQGNTDTNQQLEIGYQTGSDYGSIQAIKQGTSFSGLALNPSGGNVGVGNAAPGVKLHIGSSSVTDGTNLLRLEDANSTCNFTADSGSPSCGSDETLKKDTTTLDTENLLTKIAGLRPVSYRWKTNDAEDPLQYGFIAQEVEAQFPELVSENTWVDGTQRKFLNMGGLMPYVVGAIKEQQLQITSLDERVKVIAQGSDKETANILKKIQSAVRELDDRVGVHEATTPITGNVILPAQATKIQVTFPAVFNRLPIVQLSQNRTDNSLWVEEITPTGFIIRLSQPTNQVTEVQWYAFLAKEVETSLEVLE